MATPKKREKEGIEAVPTRDLVRSLRTELEKRLKDAEAKQPAKKPKK